MKSTTALFVAASILASRASLVHIDVDTPTQAVQCIPLNVTWTGGVGPWRVDVTLGGCEVHEIFYAAGPGFPWKTNVQGGHSALIIVTDSQGNVGTSEPFEIAPNSDFGCFFT
ncbi:hypothetical protein C8Q76DRAFT_799642 [Earliella scabrosa]|nr:hypothetical protein C8Q76DRAFT_799642 [Earliella scabrosa]